MKNHGGINNLALAREIKVSHVTVGAVLLSDPALELIRRELRKISPDARITTDQIHSELVNNVLKREVFDGDSAADAKKKIAKAAAKAAKPAKPNSPPAGVAPDVAQALESLVATGASPQAAA